MLLDNIGGQEGKLLLNTLREIRAQGSLGLRNSTLVAGFFALRKLRLCFLTTTLVDLLKLLLSIQLVRISSPLLLPSGLLQVLSLSLLELTQPTIFKLVVFIKILSTLLYSKRRRLGESIISYSASSIGQRIVNRTRIVYYLDQKIIKSLKA